LLGGWRLWLILQVVRILKQKDRGFSATNLDSLLVFINKVNLESIGSNSVYWILNEENKWIGNEREEGQSWVGKGHTLFCVKTDREWPFFA
jgi:hypothetical protein